MGQLIKATITPFQAVRFSQSARLVPSDRVDIERRKAIARHSAFQARCSSTAASVDLNYVHNVNRVFSSHSHKATVNTQNAAPQISQHSAPQRAIAQTVSHLSQTGTASAVSQASAAHTEGYTPAPLHVSSSANTQQLQEVQDAAYTTQRGAFELRVAKGELSYVPAMAMTIITQYPDVNFEYVGGFNYVPPDWERLPGIEMNVSV